MKPTRLAAFLFVWGAGAALLPRDAFAACALVTPDLRQCLFPSVIPQDNSDVATLTIEGGPVAGTPESLPGGLFMVNTGAARDQTLTTSRFVSVTGTPANSTLIEVFTIDGLNTVALGAGIDISSSDAQKAVAVMSAAATSSLLGVNSLVFDGRVDLRIGTTVTPQAGLLNVVMTGTAESRVALGAAARVFVEGATSTFGVLAISPDGAATVTAAAGSRVEVVGDGVVGVGAISSAGGLATITGAAGSQVLATGNGSRAVQASSTSGDVTVTAPGATFVGNNGSAILVGAPAGAASVDSRGRAVSATGTGAGGIEVFAADGLILRSGEVTATGTSAVGVYGSLSGSGAVVVETTAGGVTTSGDDAEAVVLELNNAAAATLSTGAITTQGLRSRGVAIRQASGALAIDTRAGAIATQGARAYGIHFDSPGTASASATLGAIRVTGAENYGALFESGTGPLTVTTQGALAADGEDSTALGLFAEPASGTVSGSVTANLRAATSASGRFGAAAVARSQFNSARVEIGSGITVSGGWEAVLGATGPFSGHGGVGVLIGAGGAGTATVANLGTLGALSDRAVQAFAGSTAPTVIDNAGTLDGYVTLAGGSDQFLNRAGAVWNLRHLAETNGAGDRDARRVAVADFGAGTDSVRNGGRLVLATTPVAATPDTAFQYVPAGVDPALYSIATPGIEQGQLTGLELFENAGIIDLRDSATVASQRVAGDVLLITSGSVAATGVFTPGATPGVFRSEGGALFVDTVLDAGGASARSDLLVVDQVQLGAGGATQVFVGNAGGLGAQTRGNGIKVVDVLGGASASAAGAFRLGQGVFAGAFVYNLFRSGPGGNDGDWYLRTEAVVQPPSTPRPSNPVPPLPPVAPPPPPPPTSVPAYRPEAALFASLPGMLRGLDAGVPGTRHGRISDERRGAGAATARRGRAWARYLSQDVDTRQTGTVSPLVAGRQSGLQFGVELFGGADEDDAQIGGYAGRVTGDTTVRGFANGVAGAAVGRVSPEATFFGLYVSRARDRGLYFDGVLQYSVDSGGALSLADGVVTDIKGRGALASLELGYGLRIATRFVVEPQLQLAWQPQWLGDLAIRNAQVEQSPGNLFQARAGLRIRGDFDLGRAQVTPYLTASVWESFIQQDRTRFAGPDGAFSATLLTDNDGRTAEFGGGFSIAMANRLNVFAEATTRSSLADSAGLVREGTSAMVGARLSW